MLKRKRKGVPQESRGWDSMLPLLGAQVQSLVRELRFHKRKRKDIGQTQTIKELVTSVLDKVQKH